MARQRKVRAGEKKPGTPSTAKRTSAVAGRSFLLNGRVIDERSRRGLAGLRVEAWDKDTRYHDMLGVSQTDSNGHFEIDFDSDYFGDYAPDCYPDVFFKVFRGKTLIANTRDSVLVNLKARRKTVVIEVDAAAAARPERRFRGPRSRPRG
jgi:hypothetical protein